MPLTVGLPVEVWEYQSHLKLMHGVWAGDVKTAQALQECHREVEATPVGTGIPHTHADLSEPLEDWSW